VLALQLPMNRRPIRLGVAAMAPFGSRDWRKAPPPGRRRSCRPGKGPTQPGALETPQRLAHRRGRLCPADVRSRALKYRRRNFKRMISRTWRIATLSAGIIAPLDCQRRDPKQASGGARRHSRPRAALFRSGGRHHLVMVGGIIPLRRATSSRYDGRLGQESARCGLHTRAATNS